MVNASLKNYRQSPRKVRLVVDAIRGKNVEEALNILTFTVKRASDPIKKLLNSAIANAKHNHNLDPKNLFIKEIRVDEGVTLQRFRPRAHGRAAPIRKRTSHVKVVLAEKVGNKTITEETDVKETPVKKTSTLKTIKKPSKTLAKKGEIIKTKK